MIYGRCGQPVTIVRRAVLGDVQRLDGRKPDKQDRACIRNKSYVVVDDGGKERLYALCYLRADRGSLEIADAIIASERDECASPDTCGVCHVCQKRDTCEHRKAVS